MAELVGFALTCYCLALEYKEGPCDNDGESHSAEKRINSALIICAIFHIYHTM